MTSNTALSDLPESDAAVVRQLWEGANLLVHCLTWNMNAKEAPKDLSALFPPNRFHVYAAATQECENTIAKSLIFSSKERWEESVTQAVGARYARLASHTLQATHLVVFVHRALLNVISEFSGGIRACSGVIFQEVCSYHICRRCANRQCCVRRGEHSWQQRRVCRGV
jgi:hypothetical protein